MPFPVLLTIWTWYIEPFGICSLPGDEEPGGFQGAAMECDPSYCQWCKDAAVHADPRGWRKKEGENGRHFLKSLACKFEIYHCNEHHWMLTNFVSAWYGWKGRNSKADMDFHLHRLRTVTVKD